MVISEEQAALLATVFLFRDMSLADISSLLLPMDGALLSFRKGEPIATRTSFRRGIGIVLAGSIRVTKGNGSLVVSVLTRGDLFGAASLFVEEERYASELSAQTACRIIFFTEAEMERMFSSSAAVSRNYIRYLSERVRFLSSKVDQLIRHPGNHSLRSYLATHAGVDGLVQPDCSYTQLAARFNVSRATLYRELRQMEEDGILFRRENKLYFNRQLGEEGETTCAIVK